MSASSLAAVTAQALAGKGDGHNVEASDAVKMPEIGCPNAPSGSNGRRGDEPVVRPDVLAGCDQVRPEAGVHASGEEAERQWRERSEDCLDERFTLASVLRGCAVHAVQQLGGGDGGEPDLLIRPQLLLQPRAHRGHGASRGQSPDRAFEVDEDGGV
jgi:hypothetical protein